MALGKWTKAEVAVKSVCASVWDDRMSGRRWNRQECVFEMQRVTMNVIGKHVEEEKEVGFFAPFF